MKEFRVRGALVEFFDGCLFASQSRAENHETGSRPLCECQIGHPPNPV